MVEKIKQSWWVILFSFLSLGCYGFASQQKSAQAKDLQVALAHLEAKRESSLRELSNLKLRLNSLDDPEWVQMILMRELGVVPEGQVKIVFK